MDTETQGTQIGATAMADVDATKDNRPRKTLENFIENATRGAQAVYHRGPFLEAFILAEFARAMHAKGHCNLVQRRINKGRSAICEYVMVKR